MSRMTTVLTPAATSLKRKQVDSEISPDASQSKRPRVAFNTDVEVREYPDWNNKPLDLIREEVRRALDKHAKGEKSAFDEIVGLFKKQPSSEDAPNSSLLRKYVVSLTAQASSLRSSCSSLVNAVIETSWLIRDDAFVTAYQRFVGDLVSAQKRYASSIISNILRQFVQPPRAYHQHPADQLIRRADMNVRLHKCLRYLLGRVPDSNSALKEALKPQFPPLEDTTKAHVDYINNILKIVDYAPELKGKILSEIMAHLIQVDAQMQTDLDDLEDEVVENLTNDPLAPNDDQEDETDSDDGSDAESEDSDVDEQEKREQEMRNAVLKMDTVLDLLFAYYHPIFAKTEGSADADNTFLELMSQFKAWILPTQCSRHTQFLVFHFAQSAPRYVEEFSYVCLDIVINNEEPLTIRVTAAAYLASFAARGAHVSKDSIRGIVGGFCVQLNRLHARYEANCMGPDLSRYGAYYAIAQALLYVFCFRWRELVDQDDDTEYDELEEKVSSGADLDWMPQLKETLRTALMHSKLNPLKICAPDIVAQFARIANHVKFMYVYSKIETNKRVRLGRTFARLGPNGNFGSMTERHTALTAQKNEQDLQLEAYFPFDPYKLPKSKRWLEGDYVAWKSIPGLEPEEESGSEEEDNDEDNDEDDFEEEATATEQSA